MVDQIWHGHVDCKNHGDELVSTCRNVVSGRGDYLYTAWTN